MGNQQPQEACLETAEDPQGLCHQLQQCLAWRLGQDVSAFTSKSLYVAHQQKNHHKRQEIFPFLSIQKQKKLTGSLEGVHVHLGPSHLC
jgi:hypothetical protein